MYWKLFLLVRHSTVEVPNYLEYVFHCNIFNLVHYYLACVYLMHYVTSLMSGKAVIWLHVLMQCQLWPLRSFLLSQDAD